MPSLPHWARARKSSAQIKRMNPPELQAEERQAGTLQVTVRLLRRFLPGQVRTMAFGLALLLLAAGAALLQPWPLKIVLDSVIGQLPVPAPVHWLETAFRGNPYV